MHQHTGHGCRGCAREAAQVIERDGSEGVQTAGRILSHAGLGNEETARGMADAQTARNMRRAFPGISVTGEESGPELQAAIEQHEQAEIEKSLPVADREKVRKARAVLGRYKLKR